MHTLKYKVFGIYRRMFELSLTAHSHKADNEVLLEFGSAGTNISNPLSVKLDLGRVGTVGRCHNSVVVRIQRSTSLKMPVSSR